MTPDRLETIIASLNHRQPDLTVLMENVIKPHNLAAVARTADSVGALEVHAITPRKSIKLSQMSAGGVRKWISVQVHADTPSGINFLKQKGYQIVATCLAEDSRDFREIDYTRPTAILVGTELEGISQQAIELADEHITIPMYGLVQSLNVSVAAALVLYEAHRQRENAGMYKQRQLDDETYMRLLFEWGHPKVAKYCQRKNIPYPRINEQAEFMEPIADSVTYTDESFADWMRKKNL
ncbi:MAG: tRNA (guanosine(18)-2'-O)-methyltransferase TrmH [Gammaproteobacteria bacterium]|nr:tRNA (guanosine(18)-2'-O)-methyltransferase TrmH [Gammaproteobacteria bacterium]